MMEGPRVERMHQETSDACVGGNCLTQNSEGPVGAMWFGPRLGRRRRSDAKLAAGKKIEALSEMLAAGTPAAWNMLTIPGTKFSHFTVFFFFFFLFVGALAFCLLHVFRVLCFVESAKCAGKMV